MPGTGPRPSEFEAPEISRWRIYRELSDPPVKRYATCSAGVVATKCLEESRFRSGSCPRGRDYGARRVSRAFSSRQWPSVTCAPSRSADRESFFADLLSSQFSSVSVRTVSQIATALAVRESVFVVIFDVTFTFLPLVLVYTRLRAYRSGGIQIAAGGW